MKSLLQLLGVILAVTLGAAEQKPNVIVFLADDLGWGDLGCYGNPIIKTPNLDAFARQGVRFTQFYAASAVCSPSRSAILTGRTPYRNGVFRWIPENSPVHLRTSEITAPRLLKAQGYVTCHVGKWHLNGYFNDPRHPQPNEHGYDWWLATQNNAGPSHENPANFVRNGKPLGRLEGYSAPIVVNEAIDWLKTQRDKSKPFFLAVWTHEPHYPIKSDPRFKALYPNLTDDVQIEHHANVTQMDYAFGKLMKALDDLKLSENTFVVFTSDNGPEGDGIKTPGRGSTGGLRGRKRDVYEGGIRVPGLVRWPGHARAGSINDTPLIGSDIFATVLDLAKVPVPKDRIIDGSSFLPALEGRPVARQKPLYWRCNIAKEWPKTAMRLGDWKIVADEKLTRFELYNLKADPQEKVELSGSEGEKFAQMKAELQKLNSEIEAEGPDWWKRDSDAAPKKAKRKKAE